MADSNVSFKEMTTEKISASQRGDFVCPSCGGILQEHGTAWRCDKDHLTFRTEQDIPDFILPSQRQRIDRFLSVYQHVRKKEGWGSEDIDYYRKLPFKDTTGYYRKIWKLRAKTFESFVQSLSLYCTDLRLRIADLGAGNCWLSARLAERGHNVVAVDVNMDAFDGLRVVSRLKENDVPEFSCIRATFDSLPFPKRSFDIIIFNASLHYSNNINSTILLNLELIKDTGAIFILDSPVYTNPASGLQMLRERKEAFRTKYGILLEDELLGNFLSYEQISPLEQRCVVEYKMPEHGFLWAIRPMVNRMFGRREPPDFPIVIVRKRTKGQLE